VGRILYPVIKTKTYYAILRYEEPNRRKDKIQGLVCQSYEKYQNDISKGKKIIKQEYKCFITQRVKQVDVRSICKKGYEGTSKIDALSFYRRRSDVDTQIVEFDEWMTAKPWKKKAVEEQLSFNIDFENWQQKLSSQEHTILAYLIQGYPAANKIAEFLSLTYQTVRAIIKKLK